jgi:hypothetical protein
MKKHLSKTELGVLRVLAEHEANQGADLMKDYEVRHKLPLKRQPSERKVVEVFKELQMAGLLYVYEYPQFANDDPGWCAKLNQKGWELLARKVMEPKMDAEEMLRLLRENRSTLWNSYRKRHMDWKPDLYGMDLRDCNLSTFDLSRAVLLGTDMSGARLTDQKNRVVMDGATFDISTKFPNFFDPVAVGAVFTSQRQAKEEGRLKSEVFISYAWANENVVHAIDQWLRNRGLLTRLDKRDFFAGARIRDEIIRTMADSNAILVFHSRESMDKPWPQFEREMASDIEMSAKQSGDTPPIIIYVVLDDSQLPSISESNRIAIMAKGKKFDDVCEEIHRNVLRLPRETPSIDLNTWSGYEF